MDSLEEQVMALGAKVDALHQSIDKLNSKLSDSAFESSHEGYSSLGNGGSYSQADLLVGNQWSSSHRNLDTVMEHKDVLIDHGYDGEHQNIEKELAPEIQIQRLTAQLTAAYNRIAALEEQLLARRTQA